MDRNYHCGMYHLNRKSKDKYFQIFTGIWYTVTVEFQISEENVDYLKNVIGTMG